MNKNIVFYAGDGKFASYLDSSLLEAANRGFNVFSMMCWDTQLKYPLHHPNSFQIQHNVENPESHYSQTLNQNLPFKPDWLVVSRERWHPEDQIVIEFKQKWNTKIALIEPNSSFINSVNQFLESESKNRFVPIIDVYFDHSEFIKDQRKKVGFKGNSVVVGNPKYDLNLDVNENDINTLKKYYNVDPNKKQVLFFTLINKFRYKLFDEFKKFKEQHPDYQYFVKPYPGEPFITKPEEYFPNFFIEGVTPILDETHIWGMFNICDIHIGGISSIMYPSFLLNKEVYEFSKQIGYKNNLESNEDIINSSGGTEENLQMWLRVFNMNLEGFKELTSKDKMLKMMVNNNKVWKNLEDLVYYREDILKMYDEFNDGKAGKRIIDYIENDI